MTTNRKLDIIYWNRETIVIIPILNIFWQNIFIVSLSYDLINNFDNQHASACDVLPKQFNCF